MQDTGTLKGLCAAYEKNYVSSRTVKIGEMENHIRIMFSIDKDDADFERHMRKWKMQLQLLDAEARDHYKMWNKEAK